MINLCPSLVHIFMRTKVDCIFYVVEFCGTEYRLYLYFSSTFITGMLGFA